MIKKSKKIMASLLMALSIISILPTTNAFALTEEENKEYVDFIRNECTPTEDKGVFFNEKDGKHYALGHYDSLGWAKPQKADLRDYYALEDGSIVKNTWEYVQNPKGDYYWQYFGSDYKPVKGPQTIDGKAYIFSINDGYLKIGWWKNTQNHLKWYHSGEDGAITEGWIQDNGSWYYIYSDGLMAKNTTIGGYTIGKDGICQ